MRQFLLFPLLCWTLAAWCQSPAPCPDTDGDGFCDSVDRQPYSPKNCEVDSFGVALDDDQDGVPNCYDKEPNSPPTKWGAGCRVIVFEDTIFRRHAMEIACDADSTRSDLPFSSKWFPELYYLAQLAKADTSLTLSAYVTGATDQKAAEIQTKVMAFLLKTYQVDPSRWQWLPPHEVDAELPTLHVTW